MPTIKQWTDTHGEGPSRRVAKRIARFAGNTGDDLTASAAQDLVEMIESALPKEKNDAASTDD